MNHKITVLTVNWYSADLIHDLLSNLIKKAQTPSNLSFLIIDNTNGKDEQLKKIPIPNAEIKIIPNQPGDLKNLHAHAHGLNYGFKQVNSEFVLIVDPDVHVFKQNWDDFLVTLINSKEIDAAGTSFPPWWLGTYHNFPSPIFCFAKMDSLQSINADWSPPKINIFTKIRNLIFRQLLRGGGIFNRRQLTSSPFLRKMTKKMEDYVPLCTLDTGFLLSQQEGLKISLFEAVYPDKVPTESEYGKSKLETSRNLARYFEFYWFNDEPILTHQYGSQNFLLKTVKGNDKSYWQTLIQDIETVQN